ncbi:carbohydrate-binding module family 14 protein [Streptomyces luteolus]|uniref:Carbohydrate-binding module family 14 protein n=1 Tax=Streptomyces luteolus TaxID=3043615 RepID=A0ABT6SZ66_9ACTN|nr:carbohydrate-binding module family 14 protein [Streptomyces sp. B-S-A12]MDI3420900.1 carbohydrate-binding module family 14 protein [Streptomyces sp. B-S-A12]
MITPLKTAVTGAAALLALAVPPTTAHSAPLAGPVSVPDSFCEGRADANYPHPERPDAFVQCSGELAYVFDCQPGLLYNPYPRPWGQCDWPDNVDWQPGEWTDPTP